MDNRIQEHREARGWTLEILAEKMGTTHTQVQRLEKGKRKLTQAWMVRLADAFGLAPSDFLPKPVAKTPLYLAQAPIEKSVVDQIMEIVEVSDAVFQRQVLGSILGMKAALKDEQEP
jgi:transcriptional regulator with XRE-family HTH domain